MATYKESVSRNNTEIVCAKLLFTFYDNLNRLFMITLLNKNGIMQKLQDLIKFVVVCPATIELQHSHKKNAELLTR